MTRSPGSSRPFSSVIVCRVGSPAGIISHSVRAGGGQRGFRVGRAVDIAFPRTVGIPDPVVPGTAEAFRHVAAHFAQADHADLHRAHSRRLLRGPSGTYASHPPRAGRSGGGYAP